MGFIPYWEPPLDFIKKSGENFVYKCPRCWRNNFWWNILKQGGQCWSCYAHWNQKGLHAELGLDWNNEGVQLNKVVRPPLSQCWETPVMRHMPGDLPPEATAFLQGDKGLLPEECGLFSWYAPSNSVYVGLTPSKGDGTPMCWMERSISINGRWNFVEGDTHGYKHTKKDFYYSSRNERINNSGINVLVEGVFDAIRLNSCSAHVHAFACLGVQVSDEILRQLVSEHPQGPLLIWFDPDKGGRRGRAQLAHKIKYSLGVLPIIVDHFLEPGDCDILQCRRVINHYTHRLLV